jgi:hypothetical protein
MRIEFFDRVTVRVHDVRLANPGFLQARMRDILLVCSRTIAHKPLAE